MQFAAETPYGIVQAYTAGEIDHAEMVEQLVHFPYAAAAPCDPGDGLSRLDPPGAFGEVLRAYREKLIDRRTYGEVVTRHAAAAVG
ncbi:hypothetical protein [Tsukamurella soli]